MRIKKGAVSDPVRSKMNDGTNFAPARSVPSSESYSELLTLNSELLTLNSEL